MKKYYKVTFLPENKEIEVEDRITIFETILEKNPHNIQLRFACGAEGICRKCKIRAFQKMGPLTPTERGCLSGEELSKGIRLACQARVIQDTQVEILYKMPFSIQLMDEPFTADVRVNPRVEKLYITADAKGIMSRERFICTVVKQGMVRGNLEAFAEHVRSKQFNVFETPLSGCTAVFIEGDLVCIEEGDTVDKKYAVAVDLGINTLVLSLLNLHEGKKIAVVTDTNPQLDIGTDFEERVAMIAENPLNLEILNEEVLLRIDILILELCRACNITPMHVYEIVIAGSTGMLHLFLKGIAGVLEQQSFTGASMANTLSAEQFDFKSSQRARIYALPVISTYAGADITAGILATQLHRSSATVLFLDVGTEIKAVLHHKGTLTATSSSCGGAFECIGVTFGMRPETGAIEHVTINDVLHMKVIGESLPRGICGSGLMELVAELKRRGIVDDTGTFVDPVLFKHSASDLARSLLCIKGSSAFLLYTDTGEFQTDIYVSQEDIYLLRKAKASMTVLIKELLAHSSLKMRDVSRVLIGGSFGTDIDIEAFFELGFLPVFLRGKVYFVGNTSKKGAQMVLLDRALLEEAEKLARSVVCIQRPRHEFGAEDLNLLSTLTN